MFPSIKENKRIITEKYKCHENHHVNHPSAPRVSHRQLLALPLSESLSPAGKVSEYVFYNLDTVSVKISGPLLSLAQIP